MEAFSQLVSTSNLYELNNIVIICYERKCLFMHTVANRISSSNIVITKLNRFNFDHTSSVEKVKLVALYPYQVNNHQILHWHYILYSTSSKNGPFF